MSSRNDETTGLVMAFAFVGAAFYIAFLFIFALLAFLSLILTVLALLAWNRPLQIGTMMIEPDEARRFVMGGIAGAAIVPTFAVFCALLFGFGIADQAWFYLLIGGYVAGSIGLEILRAEAEQNQPPVYTPPETRLSPPPPALPPAPSAPFRFADWDDEEERE